MTLEALFHSFAALDAGDAVATRFEDDPDRFGEAHLALGCRRNWNFVLDSLVALETLLHTGTTLGARNGVSTRSECD